ncbi:uncharacterized protein LOC129216182 [Uloborus diversus]|uniref:uncharacterized protein LOC129216182 n=1 Tax=Uloborus diversus TaxID=327109 RepID=UPI00240A5ABA|nr:uncharacterized protein LOC129216182 [Uloborus diversus]
MSYITIHRLICILCVISSAIACVFLSDDAKPKGLEERALDSEVVLAAYTRTVYRNRNNTTSYSAEFLVFNILKGEGHVVEVYQKRKPSSLETALNRRLVNVSNFGDPTKCQSDVSPGETYILFLDVLVTGELGARYDGVYGPAVLYSRDKEMALETIGSSPWSEWSPCSGSCGGGIQQRRRQCDGGTKCSNNEGQQRTCNMFPCTSVLNILEAADFHRSPLRPPGRPTAYRLLASGSWRSREEELLFPRTFPWEFSLLVTVHLKPASSGGFLLRVLHSGTLQVGLYISDTLTLVLSDKDNVRVSFVKPLSDDHWHQLAFSVRRNTVSFYLNCEFSGKLPLPGKIRPFGGQPATVIVGSTGPQELDAFQGDIEQITITGSPDAAENQCNSTTQPLHFRTADRQEIRSRPISSIQSDQLPLRGDIIDDEDFSFEESGSGHKTTTVDDDYDDYNDEEDDVKADSSKKKPKIPIKAETTDDEESNSDEDEETESDEKEKEENNSDEDDDEETDSDEREKEETIPVITSSTTFSPFDDQELKVSDRKNNEADYNYDHIDEEFDQNEKDVEGSGAGTQFELAWSEWSPCSATCSWGRRSRTSYCLDNGLNLESCTEASARRSETEACFLGLCPTTPSTTMTTITTTATELILTTNVSVPVYKLRCRVKCHHGGTCYPPHTCYCSKGYYGSLCQYAKQVCKVNCRNGGICHPPATCACAKGYIGNECQYPVCKPYCLNGGICISPNTCRCKPGYVGKSCQKAVCKLGCKNGGECVAPNKCACRSGFTGADCGQALCEPGCQNGGQCVKPYFCHCPSGTRGSFCEKILCKPECQNGGVCIGPDRCSCPRGYAGYFCEQVYCPGGCLNGGKCSKSGKCSCPLGYSGLHCEIRKPCKFVEVKEPYKRGYKQKVATQVKVPCGAWGWKMCTKTKVHYEMVYKTFFKTSYECEEVQQSKYPNYQKLKNG